MNVSDNYNIFMQFSGYRISSNSRPLAGYRNIKARVIFRGKNGNLMLCVSSAEFYHLELGGNSFVPPDAPFVPRFVFWP
jgi:hypothetical protein